MVMRLPRPQKLYPYGLAGAPHNDGAAVVRGGRADVVGRCVGVTTRAVVGGWVVVGRAVVGGIVVVRAAVVGAAVVAGTVVVEATGRAAVLAGGVGGVTTNPHQAKQGHDRDSRQGGDDLLPPIPRAVGAGPRRQWCAPLRWRWWLLALW